MYSLVEFNRFSQLSRTNGLFPRLSSPGKCHNKVPGLSRFSRTCTNPVNITCTCMLHFLLHKRDECNLFINDWVFVFFFFFFIFSICINFLLYNNHLFKSGGIHPRKYTCTLQLLESAGNHYEPPKVILAE